MGKIIHVCFSVSSAGGLKHAIKSKIIDGDKVIGFFDDLSNGSICNLNDIGDRVKWWKYLESSDEFDTREFLKENYNKFNKDILEITSDDTIYLWCSENAMELMGLMYTFQLLSIDLYNIYIINVSKVTYNQGMKNEFTPRAVGEVAPERFPNFVEINRKVEKDCYENFMDNLSTLIQENGNLRVYENGSVISVGEDYFDNLIMKYTENEFRKSARTVGNVIGFSEKPISDTYIFWRVLELIKDNKLQYKGKFGIMREMEIKKMG